MNEPALDAEGRALIRATPVATLATALAADGGDAEGCDLRLGSRTARIGFEAQIATPAQARAALVSLAKQDEDS